MSKMHFESFCVSVVSKEGKKDSITLPSADLISNLKKRLHLKNSWLIPPYFVSFPIHILQYKKNQLSKVRKTYLNVFPSQKNN